MSLLTIIVLVLILTVACYTLKARAKARGAPPEPTQFKQSSVPLAGITITTETSSYYNDPDTDIYLETPHPNLGRKAFNISPALKDDENIVRSERVEKFLKIRRNSYSDDPWPKVEYLPDNHRRFTYKAENLGAGQIVLTNKSLFLVPDCLEKPIRIGRRAISRSNHSEKKALRLYKHDYRSPYDYLALGLDVTSWWKSIGK